MKDKIFVDTNILIYGHDRDTGSKHEVAVARLQDLWEKGTGVLRTQVLQEFYVNVTRKILHPLSPTQARGIIGNYLAWEIGLNKPDTVLLASEIEERYKLSFWDALIMAAASRAGVSRILTEDLNQGQVIEGIFIENPFKT